jgi:hypothetical protein
MSDQNISVSLSDIENKMGLGGKIFYYPLFCMNRIFYTIFVYFMVIYYRYFIDDKVSLFNFKVERVSTIQFQPEKNVTDNQKVD